MSASNGHAEPLKLTREQIVDKLETGARRRLKMSAREMIDAYREGRLEDAGAVLDLLMLANLLEDDDDLFVSVAA